MSKFLCCCLVLLFVSVPYLHAQGDHQQTLERPTFKKYLNQLEQLYSVHFSYSELLIADISPPDLATENMTLDSVIASMQAQMHLKFEKISADYLVIRPFKASDKVSFCGRILDDTGQPLVGALIQVRGLGKTLSDTSGFFRIDQLAYGDSISISYLHHFPKVIPVNELLKLECPEIRLTPNINILKELFVVENYTLPGISKVSNKLVFDPEELKLIPGWIEPDIMQTIQLSPGVSTPFESAANLYVRGSTPDQNLVLWNGIKTYNQSHFFGALSIFNPSIPQKVEFIKNGTDPFYGDRVSSVINIETNGDITETTTGSVGLNMLNGDLYLKSPIVKKKLSVDVSARRSYAGLLNTPTYQQFSERQFQNTKIAVDDSGNLEGDLNQFFFQDFSATGLFQPNKKNSFRFNTLLTNDELSFVSSSDDTEYSDFLRTGSDGYNLQWKYLLSEQKTIRVETYLVNYGLFYNFTKVENNEVSSSKKNNLIREYGLKTKYNADLSESSKIVLGYQYTRSNVQYAFNDESDTYYILLDHGNESLGAHALTGLYDFDWNRFSLSMGSRLSYLDLWDSFLIEPRIGIRYAPLPSLTVGVNYESRTQSVSQVKESVVSDLSLENQMWALATPDGFPIIKSNQFSALVNFNADGWLIEMEGYHKRMDGITTLTFGFLNPDPSNNDYQTGTSIVTGADIFLQKRIDRYSIFIGYSYIQSENNFTGLFENLAFPGNWNIRHTLKSTFFYTYRGFDLSAGWVWHTGKVYTESSTISDDGETLVIDFEELNKSLLPTYHRLDLSASYRLVSDHNIEYKMGFSLINIYARQNLINRELRKEPLLDLQLLESTFFGLGFTPNVVLRISW